MKNKQIYVVIPVHNEAKHLTRCLRAAREKWPRIIVVNDGSNDRSSEILAEFTDIEVVTLSTNLGKGKAMRAGAERAWKKGAEAVIFMDGDNQHSPKHITEFVRILKRGYPCVIGMRVLRAEIPLYRRLGNNLMAWLMQRLFGVGIPDMMCGYRAFTKEGYRQVKWQSQRYGVEVEVLTIIGRKKLPYQTVVVDTIYHDKYKGFSIWDGMKILLSLPYYKVRRL